MSRRPARLTVIAGALLVAAVVWLIVISRGGSLADATHKLYASTKEKNAAIVLRPLDAGKPWEAYLLPVSSFPAATEETARLVWFFNRFGTLIAAPQHLSTELFVQANELELGDGADRFSRHAPQWVPQTGLGVWPDRKPPEFWKRDDFEKLALGGKPRPLLYQVFRLAALPDARAGARDVMLGIGATIQILLPGPPAEFFQRTKALLLPPIQEEALRSYPFYVPLLDRKSVDGSDPQRLDEWMCGARIYIRESVEDKAILIVSKQPLTPLLEQLGGRFQRDPDPVWHIPLPNPAPVTR